VYRDERQICPRCTGDLIDAGAGRACAACAGLWIEAAIVQDMATRMQTPIAPLELPWEEQARPPLVCPTCTKPMRTMTLYGVPVDLCGKDHGVWFDAKDLALVLLSSARKPT